MQKIKTKITRKNYKQFIQKKRKGKKRKTDYLK